VAVVAVEQLVHLLEILVPLTLEVVVEAAEPVPAQVAEVVLCY